MVRRGKTPTPVATCILDPEEVEVEEVDFSNMVITKQDMTICSLYDPRPLTTKGCWGTDYFGDKENQKSSSAKKGRKRVRAKTPTPSPAKSSTTQTQLKEGCFFVWISEMTDAKARPEAWRVSKEGMATKFTVGVELENNEVLYEPGKKHGIVPYFEEECVIVLPAVKNNDDSFRLTMPSQEDLDAAKKKMEFVRASKELDNSPTKLSSACFGSLTKKKPKINTSITEADTGEPSKKSPAEIAADNESALNLPDDGEVKKTAAAAQNDEDEETAEFIDAIFHKAIFERTKGEALANAEALIRKKLEELEDAVGGKELKDAATFYGNCAAKECGTEKKRTCEACGAKSKKMSMISFSEPTKLGRAGEDPLADFVVFFACPEPCTKRVAAIGDLLKFTSHCLNRVKRRWAQMLAEERHEPKASKRDEDTLFNDIINDKKIRVGLAKSYKDLLKRVQLDS